MSNRTIKLFLWFTILVVVMACAPSFSTPLPVPTLDPGAINTYIAQTANAASTQTFVALPTSTPTETFTPTPRNTDTPEPTATNTVVFIISTPTASVVPTFTGINDATVKKDYACIPFSVNPTNGTSFDPRVSFIATWKIKNNGKKEWDRKIVDYIYQSGDKFHKISGYDLSKSVPVGVTTDITVDMEAPKNPGTYTTYWTLKNDSSEFCKVSLSIVVKEPPVEPSATVSP